MIFNRRQQKWKILKAFIKKTDNELIIAYKKYKDRLGHGKLTIPEQGMYIKLLTEIGDRWIKQIENK